MEPSAKSFPLLNFVMSRVNSVGRRPQALPGYDIEQPPSPSRPPASSAADEVELMERMPGLADSSLIASMASAVSDVSQTRSVIRALGDRPDHETVDSARSRLSEIDAELARHLTEIVTAPRPDAFDVPSWRVRLAERERDCRAASDREKAAYKAVLQLDEMHESYQQLLRDAEERLVRIYETGQNPNASVPPAVVEEVQPNEEVIGILQQAKGIERVDLSGRQLRIIPDAFGKLQGLVSLNLSKNQLEGIPDAIGELVHLVELFLSSNFLVSLPDSIGLLLNLKILDVSGNKLKLLPDSISKCRSLMVLDASYNELTYLPTNIGHELVRLEKLFVHLNKIRALPTSVCSMSSLRVLDAHFNELRGLPGAIGNLTNLEILNVSSNFSDMTELPSTIGDLMNLKELDISNNQIHALPDRFGRLDKLCKLNLEQNPLILPPPEIASEGLESIKDYMMKRWLDMLVEEEQRHTIQEVPQNEGGWLTRSTSWLNNWVTGVSGGLSDYLGVGEKPYKDPALDQQL